MRDSSGKPAARAAGEDLERIARPERSEGHALFIRKRFSKQFNSQKIFYADGHHSITTSNHGTMLNFAHSMRTMHIRDTNIKPMDPKEVLIIAERYKNQGWTSSFNTLA